MPDVNKNLKNIEAESVSSNESTQPEDVQVCETVEINNFERKPIKSENKFDDFINRPAGEPVFFNSRRFKRGGFSVIITAIFVAAVVLFNVVVDAFLSRFNVRADLTEHGLYSIEKSTAEYLAAIDDTVNFYFCNLQFANFGTPYAQAVEIAERFTESNKNFTISFIDKLTNPGFASMYGGNLADTDIIIESQNTGRFRVIKYSDYILVEYLYQGQPVSYEEASYYAEYFGASIDVATSAGTEEAFLSAVMSVTDVFPVRIAFTEGFNEGMTNDTGSTGRLFSTLIDVLEKNAYMTEMVNMFTAPEIDPGIDILIIYTPLVDFDAEALNKIDKWLDNNAMYGKSLIFFPSARDDIRETPNLDAFIAEWGLKVEQGYVWQSNPSYASSSTNYEQYVDAVGDFSEGVDEKPFIGIYMRPVTLIYDTLADFSTQALITGYEGTVFTPFGMDEEYEFFEETLLVAAMSQKQRYEGHQAINSNIIVFGSPYFFFPDYIQAQQLSNSLFLLNMFSELSGREQNRVFLMPKSYRMTRFEIDAAQANSIAVTFVIILPLVIIVTGCVVFFRRRYR